MSGTGNDPYSAGEQGLGYIYQPRFGLLKLLEQPEDTSLLIEKGDDLDFNSDQGSRSLASLKHKAIGGRLTDLSVDFWKSIRIWLARYSEGGRVLSTLRFYLFTTETVGASSFLVGFLDGHSSRAAIDVTLGLLQTAIERSSSKLVAEVAVELGKLDEAEREDFLGRITIFDGSPRIDDVPALVKDRHMRSIRREFRQPVFERLEGWWHNMAIALLSGARTEPLFGYEVSDRLSAIAAEYTNENLPITFRGVEPAGGIDPDNDPRMFVVQLREIGVSSNRIRSAILDYYRAFEQRSAWARQTLLVTGEIDDYEQRLVDEWKRYRDVVFEELDEDTAEEALVEAGRALYRWADLETGKIDSLRIRKYVDEPYVVRGGYHILANATPLPHVYWHPRFLARIGSLLGSPA